MCFAAFGLLVGLIVGEALYGAPTAFVAIPLSVAAVLFLVVTIVKKSRRFFYIPFMLIVGICASVAANAIYDARLIEDTYSEEITATVASEIVVDDATVFKVTDIYVDGRAVDGLATVEFDSDERPSFKAGDIVKLKGYVDPMEHERFDSFYSYFNEQRIYHRIYTFEVIKLSESRGKFPFNLQMKIKNMLYKNLDPDTASICIGLILGDKYGMSDELMNEVNAAGLAHVLAVSGLHISLLSTFLYFILKKLKLNPKIAFAIVTGVTFFYVALCNFTVSALRAFIMGTVFTFADMTGFKKDGLSTLSFAAILICLFRPSSFMSVGFLLSFFSLFGTSLFYKPLKDFFMKPVLRLSPKRHIGSKIADGFALSISANVMIYPFLAMFFNRFSVVFLLSCIVMLPLIMALFILLIILTVFALITTLSPALIVMKYLFVPFKVYLKLIGGLSFAQIKVSAGIVMTLFYCFTLTGLSRYVFLTSRQKLKGTLAALPLAAVLVATALLV